MAPVEETRALSKKGKCHTHPGRRERERMRSREGGGKREGKESGVARAREASKGRGAQRTWRSVFFILVAVVVLT